MDKLSEIIQQFTIHAGVFFTGQLCGLSPFEDTHIAEGHVHILRSGELKIEKQGEPAIVLDEPAIVFFPRPKAHRLVTSETDGAHLICATVSYGIGLNNPLTNALPDVMVLPLSQANALEQNIAWILQEATGEALGRQTILNRLMEVFIVCLLRHLINEDKIEQGMLAGLANPQLAKVLNSIHQQPEKAWSLDEMAEVALMSRSKFSPLFKDITGITPNEYLTQWRVSVAQTHLLAGKGVEIAANSVGYDSPASLNRAFQKVIGTSPSAWLSDVQSI
ncbi:cupin domain-containing protein [Thalassotalea euphylliae]|uniref:AraC family transcriptional regulator n=1 Tax=Thalassotalea euphylliae TaxID=1655234 RepID=UPI00363C5426